MHVVSTEKTAPANAVAFTSALLAGIPSEIRSTFSEAQLAALAQASKPQQSRHRVDFRVSIPVWPGRRLYMRLLAGRERRNAKRLATEGQSDPARIVLLLAGIAAMLAWQWFLFNRLVSG